MSTVKFLVKVGASDESAKDAIRSLLTQTCRELSIKCGLEFTLEDFMVESEAPVEHEPVVEAVMPPETAASVAPPKPAAEPEASISLYVIGLDAETDFDKTAPLSSADKALFVARADTLTRACALGQRAVEDTTNAVVRVLVVSSTNELLAEVKAPEAKFGLRYYDENNNLVNIKSWFDSVAEAHRTALMAALHAANVEMPWVRIKVCDFRHSKANPAVLFEVSND